MAIAIPNHPDGYCQPSIGDMEIADVFGLRHRAFERRGLNKKSKNAFDRVAPPHYHLVDRWMMMSESLRELFKAVESVSLAWAKHIRGKLILDAVRRLVLFLRFSQRYNYQAEFIFASSFGYSERYLRRVVWILNNRHLKPDKQLPDLKFKLPKAKLIKLSKLWCDDLMDDAIKIHKKYPVQDGDIV